jgi:transcriptional regulator with XRE-family HTH domain
MSLPQPSPILSTAPLPALADPPGCEECCLVPGSLQRVRSMQSLREQGWSLDEIALRFGVSRERVRQIMRAHGGPAAADIAEARRRRAEAQAEARIDELLARWRAGQPPRVAASELGLQAAACRSTIERFATDADHAARKASMAGARWTQTYSDRDIILALVSVAGRVGRVPSAKEYALHARDLNYPSLPTVLNRMGGWTQALRAAGLATASAPSRTRKRRWTETACWRALRRVVGELGEIPTVLAYERHAAGRPDLPSSATLRNRLGRWSAITTQLAAQEPRPAPAGTGRSGARAARGV